MTPRRSARVVPHGRGPGRCRGGGRTSDNANQEVNLEQTKIENEEVGGEEEHSVVGGVLVAGGAAAPVQGMTFPKWMSMRLDMFDGSKTPTDAADWLHKMEKVMAPCRDDE